MTSRRRFLAAVAAEIGVTCTGRVGALDAGTSSRTTVALEAVADGFTSPVGFEAPTGTDRRYVVDQAGVVSVLGSDRPFLDVTDRMVSVSGYDERGLLGMAFHSDFPEDGRCFVRYSAPPRQGTPSGYDHTFVLSEFEATPERADPDSERTLLEIPEPQSNHNAGAVAFGPDGYCYVGVGDGGGAGDQGRGHVEDWYDPVAGGNGQDVTQNLLGSVLRIDVDSRSGERPYGIPADNPLVGREGLDEHYAWGLRNPWRLSFDGDRLLVADVGQNEYEEVDLVERGGNYGWNVREGTHCYGAGDCPAETPTGEPLRDPVIEYSHDLGIAVIGGYVYRGSAAPELRGQYVFGDWQGSDGGPTLFSATPGEGLWSMHRLSISGEAPGRHLLAFGEDPDGELYVCTSDRSGVGGSTGAVHRIASTGGGTESPTSTGSTATDGRTTGASERSTPGFGTLVGGAGVAGAVGYLLRRKE